MNNMSAEQFFSLGQFLVKIPPAEISKTDLEKIANITEAVRLLEQELRTRYTTTFRTPTDGGRFSKEVMDLSQEVILQRGRGAYNTNNLILYALIETYLMSPEQYMTPQQIALRIDRVIQTVITSKGTAQNLMQPPYFIDSKRGNGWRLGRQ